jgi:pimeloyl-ACP methyl ester carboxylesterase
VLVHGLGSQWQIWKPVLDRIAQHRDVIAVDLPGFGESLTLRDEAPTVEALSRAVAAFCREDLGVETAHVGGNSLGGGIALELARTGFARSVCAISPIGFYSDREMALTRATLLAGRKVAHRIAARADALMRLAPARVAALAQYSANPLAWPADEAAAAIRNLSLSPGWEATFEHAIGWRWTHGDPGVPVTIAWGTLDGSLIPSQARTAARELPAARHVSLRRRGHTPMWEAPDDCVELLLSRATAVAGQAPPR